MITVEGLNKKKALAAFRNVPFADCYLIDKNHVGLRKAGRYEGEAFSREEYLVLTREEYLNDPNGIREMSEFDGSIRIEPDNQEFYCFRLA